MKLTFLVAAALAAPLVILAADKPGDVCAVTDSAVLEINGTKLSLADLEHKDPSLLFSARSTYYEAQRKAIDAFVDQYLLEQQAKTEGLTVAQLLEKHVNSTIAKDPSEEALHVYYEGVDTNQPYEAVRGQIVEALRQRRIAKAKAAYIQSLHNKAEIAVLLAAPRAQISLKDVDFRGPQNAQVTLVEYADYECPYCQQAQPALNKLEEAFKGKIAFVYKDMPLPMHAHAQKAAEASRCAEAQGKYWEYHDMLYANKQLDVPSLKTAARQLKLDEGKFDTCLDSGATVSSIKASSDEATALGVQGTPTIFINGRYYNGALTYDKLQAAVEEELRKTAEPSAQIAKR
ncbi:MAG: DsbA family protein [Acidobacteriaceae bacterium]|nr:DsbA family protein [Acidobacteriaceae bacterium]